MDLDTLLILWKMWKRIMKIQIVATDGTNVQVRNFKKGTSIYRAMKVMERFYEEDYLSLTYSLYVDDVLICELEAN